MAQWKHLAVLAYLVFGFFVAAPSSQAVEEARLFLEDLRARGYYDTANDYLECIGKSDFVDDEFKISIPYEQAKNLVAEAQTIADARVRDARLDEAVARFQDFAKSQPNHPLADSVQMEIGTVYMALAEAKSREAKSPTSDRPKLMGEARGYFEKAIVHVANAEELIQARRKVLEEKKDKVTPDEKETRDTLRIEWVRSELAQAMLTYKIAETFEEGSDERKAQLQKSIDEYDALFNKHRRRLAGLYSRVQQGRCYGEKGDYENAHNCFAEMWDQDDKIAPLRNLKIEALRYAMDTWLAQKKYDDALKMNGITLKQAEEGSEHGLNVLLSLARANKLKSDSIQDLTRVREKKILLTTAESLAKKVAEKATGDLQAEARALLDALGAEVVVEAPKTFDDAFNMAVAAMQKRTLAKNAADKATGDRKATLEEKAQEETDNAFKYLQTAVGFADNETDSRKLASALTRLCFLNYERGDHLRAAVLGDYVSQNFPQDKSIAKFGTYIAMNAWLLEYGQAWRDKEFETEQIKRLAQRIIEKFPDSTEAVDANYRLLIFAVQDGVVDDAIKYLAGIPEDSPRRGKAELTLGQKLWSHYVRSLRAPEDERLPQAELDKIVNEAQKVLTDGITRMEKAEKVDGDLVGAAFSLAQLYAGINEPLKAIALFEHPLYGSLTLVKAKDKIAIEGNYELKTLQLAIRTYIGALPSYSEAAKQKELVDKAMGMFEALETAVGSDAEGAEKLTGIYKEMGRELEDQIQFLVQQGNTAGKAALSGAFETVLDNLRQRPQANDYKSLIWIAETFFSLGKSNDTDDCVAGPIASNYYTRAAETYSGILARADQTPGFIKNPRQRTTIEIRLASCFSRTDKFDKALELLVRILKRKQSNLTVQVAAAKTLYEYGCKDCSNYVKSIAGAAKDEETDKAVIWGWRRLSQLTQKEERFQDYFFEANLYIVKCRLDYALCIKESDRDRSDEVLAATQTTLLGLYEQYPTLGGEEMKSRYEEVFKKLQKATGKEPTGLPAAAEAA